MTVEASSAAMKSSRNNISTNTSRYSEKSIADSQHMRNKLAFPLPSGALINLSIKTVLKSDSFTSESKAVRLVMMFVS